MQDRYLHILDAAIREFIATGEPVSSSQLFRKYDFGIKPAMIRAELARLTEDGYLEQLYHSAGRIPSNRGYEFFATQIMEAPDPPAPYLDFSFEEGETEHFLDRISKELGLAAVLGTEEGEVMKEGLEPLMEHLAWGPREEILQVIRDFESIEERLRRLRERMMQQDFLEIFIGRKSPLTESDELAVIAGDYLLGDEKVLLVAIGPKRMNYEKAAAIFKGLKKLQI